MSDETRQLRRIIHGSVRDTPDAYSIQAQAGPVTAQALEGLIFRAAHPVVERLAPTRPSCGRRCCRTSCARCW